MRILIFGASITQGFWDSEGGWVSRIRKQFDAQTTRGLADIADEDVIEIINLGVPGETSSDMLTRFEAEARARIAPGAALQIVIAEATNDIAVHDGNYRVSPEQSRRNLEQLVQQARQLTPYVVLLGVPSCDEAQTNPTDWGDSYSNADLEKLEAVVASVASWLDVPHVPVFAAFQAKVSSGEQLLADGLHPNDAGHALIAELVLPVIKQFTDRAISHA